jgi:hypothetical protein
MWHAASNKHDNFRVHNISTAQAGVLRVTQRDVNTSRLSLNYGTMGVIRKAFATAVFGGTATAAVFSFWTRNSYFVPLSHGSNPSLCGLQELQSE